MTHLIETRRWKCKDESKVACIEQSESVSHSVISDSLYVSCQVPLSMGFSRKEYWSGLPFSSPGELPDPGIKPGLLPLQAGSLPSEPGGKSVLNKNMYYLKVFNKFIYIWYVKNVSYVYTHVHRHVHIQWKINVVKLKLIFFLLWEHLKSTIRKFSEFSIVFLPRVIMLCIVSRLTHPM